MPLLATRASTVSVIFTNPRLFGTSNHRYSVSDFIRLGRRNSAWSFFGADRRQQSLDVADAVGPAGSWATDHARDMVRDQGAAEIHFIKGLHEFVHVRVAVIHEGLHETRDWPADVAKVNLPELVHFREGTGRFEHILPHLLAAFHPGARAQTNADVGTVGNLQGPQVAVELPEDAARHAA